MHRLFHDWKPSHASGLSSWVQRLSRRMRFGHFPSRAFGPLFFSLLSAGCNIVQGFQQAGDTLFPQQSTHLAEPGVQLVSGNYRELGFAVGADIFLLARGGDDADASSGANLFTMRYAEPRPCAIPSVGRYYATRNLNRSPPLIAYFHEDVGQGTLHFADANCKRFDLELADASFPLAETDASLVIRAGSDLWLTTPETGAQEQLATGVQDYLGSVLGQHFAVRAGGKCPTTVADCQILLFDTAWKPEGAFGDGVSTVRQAGKSLFFVDTAGLHRLTSAPGNVPPATDELLASDACRLGMQDSTWATYRSPCSGGPVLAVHEPTGHQFTLPFDADPQALKLVPARLSPGLDPTRDPFWFFGLRDGDTDATQNQLVVKPPSGPEFTLGAHATLQQLRLLQSEDDVHGYALVDVGADDSGRYLWWDATGNSKELAKHALWRPSRLIVDFDGTLRGKLAVVSGDRLVVLAEGVPWPQFEFRDLSKKWTVLFHDLELPGQNGQLSAFPGTLDDLLGTPPAQPFVAPKLESIAPSVGVFRSSGLNEVLSGVIYLADFDVKASTGRLEYRNLELRFTAVVNQGVSDYIVTEDQVLYAIPRGEHAGIWLASGK